jgi:hypothetical protein
MAAGLAASSMRIRQRAGSRKLGTTSPSVRSLPVGQKRNPEEKHPLPLPAPDSIPDIIELSTKPLLIEKRNHEGYNSGSPTNYSGRDDVVVEWLVLAIPPTKL